MPKKKGTYVVAAELREMPLEERCQKLARWFFTHMRHTETDGILVEEVHELAGSSHFHEEPPLIYITP